MQSVSHPVYTYDATGKLTNYVPSGSTNDVVAEHVLLDPRIEGPRSLVAGGLQPTVLNSPHLFVPPMSVTSPPIRREKTIASVTGYANVDSSAVDIHSLTQATPLLSLDRRNNTPADNSNAVSRGNLVNPLTGRR